MHRFYIIFTVLSILLSVLGAPLQFGQALDKREPGRGTWFYDGMGACGSYNNNDDTIVAISANIYDAGAYCGQWVSVTNTENGQVAHGMIRDECQSCTPDDLDMSMGLFEKLGDLSAGVLPITWYHMPVGWSPP